MRRRLIFAALSLLLSATSLTASAAAKSDLPEGYPITDRSKELLNADWKFHLGDPDADYYKTSTADSSWESVTIPHTLELTDIKLNDYMDSKVQETFMRKVGWYRRDIHVGNSTNKVYLEFEGVHQITTLWVNGRKVGVHSVGGYTPFNFDITPYVKRGAKNQITILADNRTSTVSPPDPGPFDFVKFSGLYRDLYLVEKNQMHISSNLESMYSGVTITTPSVDYVNGNATIDIRTEIHNESKKSQTATIVQRVVDAEGNVVLKLSETATIPAGARHRTAQIGGIDDNVKFWSPNSPYLYKVNTTLYDASGRAIDVVDNRLGLRKVEYDHESGVRINGESIKLVGFNRHQHFAYIGDAMPNSLHYRDMIQFKELGLNCVRTAHYPQDDELIKACDELGILVYEEAPTWISISKEKEWYSNWRKATEAMIRNHKNSPSVIIWGAGLNHRGAVAEAQFVAKLEDPTRLTASQSSRWTGWQNSGWSDIFAQMMYDPGIWNRDEPLLAMEGWYGPKALAPFMKDPMTPGMISWTAHAYYTFHVFQMDNKMDTRTRLGAMDAYRYPKDDMLYWYPAEFMPEPYIHVCEPWTEGLKRLTIYSNATEIELFSNGKSLGRYYPSRALIYKGLSHAPYEIENPRYEEGELRVVGYRNGHVMTQKSVFTPTAASKINLIADQYGVEFLADGNDIVTLHAEVMDKNGMRIRDYEGEITFSVEGDGEIVGDKIGKGYNPANVVNGTASALVRSGKSVGEITVTAKGEGLTPMSVTLKTTAPEYDRMKAEAYPICDRESIMVDLGDSGQLLQFGWTAWDSKEESSTTVAIRPAVLRNFVAGDTPPSSDVSDIVEVGAAGAYKFTIKTNSKDGVLRWMGEMNVIGKENFVYGDGVLCSDKRGLTLLIESLPAGSYALKSYHHAPSSNTNEMDPNLDRLKSESIHKLPYSKMISVSVNGKKQLCGVKTSEGKSLQYDNVATSLVEFTVAKSGEKVEIHFESEDNINGIWLNGFEFTRFL